MLRQIIPRNARSKRALEKKEPQIIENSKNTLILRGEKSSQIVQLALADINLLKRPLSVKFTKKNPIHPFEDVASLEFLSEKNDCALMVLGLHSKKRPHALTLIRLYGHKVLDILELYIDPETFRTISQFKGAKASVGLKPMISFSGTLFDSPTANAYTLAKSMFIDLFRGQEVPSIDVEGLQYMIHIAAAEEQDGQPLPQIQLRVYRILTKKSGQKLPIVETEEMGPRMDFRVGRTKEAEEAIMKEALKKPKQLQPKTKKNIETDPIGDKIGRIHMGKQDLSNLQTRKMKGLKRHLDSMALDEDGEDDDKIDGVKIARIS